jgi:hypothetical protein
MGSYLQRFLGGSPGSVLLKLLFLSLLVGAFMSFLGLTPADLLQRGLRMLDSVLSLGFDAFGEIGQWVAYGAMVVVPVWLVLRLFGAAR